MLARSLHVPLNVKNVDMLTCWYLTKCPLKFGQRQIDGIVLDISSKTVNGLEKYVDFAKIARR
jgi:hypothetical protein